MKRLRCQRAVRHPFAGRRKALGFAYGRVWVAVLRCYDQGAANGRPGNRWDRWAAHCRGEA